MPLPHWHETPIRTCERMWIVTMGHRLVPDSALTRNTVLCMLSVVAAMSGTAAVLAGDPGHDAYAQQGGSLDVTAVGSLVDDTDLLLGGPRGVDTFVIGTDTYAAVTSITDDGLQLVNVTDPDNPEAAGKLEDDTDLLLGDPRGVDTFVIGTYTYAAVASFVDDGLQIIKLTVDVPLAPDTHVTTPEDTPVTVTPEIPDPHGDLPAITKVGMPANGTTISTATSITYTPAQDYVGDDSFGYTVSYGEVKKQGTITVTVTRDNKAPVLGGIIHKFVNVGDQLTIVPTVTDDDPTDAHTYSIASDTLPEEAVFTESDGRLAWTPARDDAGEHTVTITVDDGRGGTDSETFNIFVRQQNDPPQLPALDFTVAEGTTLTGDIEVTDDTPGGGLTFTPGTGTPPGLTVERKDGSGTDAVIAWTAPAEVDVEEYSFSMTVSDGVSNVTETVTINIEEVNQDPEFDIVLTQRIALEDVLELPLNATDGDRPEQVLSYNITGQPAPAASISSGSALTWTPAALGNHTITVTVTDDFDPPGSDSAEISVEVVDVLKPVITLNGTQSVIVELGGAYAEQGATVSDNDPDYATTEATVGGDAVDAGTAGVYTVTYTAPADEAGNKPDAISRTVTVQDTNAPVITVLGDNPLRHELAEPYVDPGARSDDGSEVVTDDSAVDVDQRGDYTVTYTATDGKGNKGMADRTVQVRDGTKPVIALNGAQSVTVELDGAYTELGATVTDNDQDYAGEAAPEGAVDAGAVGVYTITYTAPADAEGNEPVPVTRTVTVRDTPPTAGPVAIQVAAGQSVDYSPVAHGDASDPQTPVGELAISVSDANTAGKGTAEVLEDGQTIRYAANPDADGTDDFDYVVTDNGGLTATAAVTVTITDNPAPQPAGSLAFTVREGQLLNQTIAITDETPGAGLTFSLDGDHPSGLTVTSKDGSDTDALITWQAPGEVEAEEYSFELDISDGVNEAVTETVTITITEVNQDPEFDIVLTQRIAPEDVLELPLNATDGDRPEQALSYGITGQPVPPASIGPSNVLTWDPEALGNHTITVTVTDDFDPPGSDSAEISVEVVDVLKPVITLNGDRSVTVELGNTYAEPGASVSDNDPAYSTKEATIGGDAVDAGTAGTYTVTYTAPADASGNEPDPVSRTVTVQDAATPTPEPPTRVVGGGGGSGGGGSGGGGSGGGGSGGGGSGGGGSGGLTNVDLTGGGSYPVDIKSISWDCSEGIILVTAKPDSEDLHVSVRTTEHGVRQAEALTADDLPVATGYRIFTAPMHENERYIGVNAVLLKGSQMFTDSESINVDSCVGHKTYGYIPVVTPGDIVQVADGLIGQEPADVVNVALVDPPAGQAAPTEPARMALNGNSGNGLASAGQAAPTEPAQADLFSGPAITGCGEGVELVDGICLPLARQGAADDPLPDGGATADPLGEGRCDFWCWITVVDGSHALPVPFLGQQCGFWCWLVLLILASGCIATALALRRRLQRSRMLET